MRAFFTNMAKTESKERFMDFGVTGRFGIGFYYSDRVYAQGSYGLEEKEWDRNEYGIPQLGWRIYGTDDKRWGIYQRRKEGGKPFFIRERFYHPTNPQTVPQQAWRTIFANGMAAWKLLTSEQKLWYHTRASKMGLHGVNLYMKIWLNSN